MNKFRPIPSIADRLVERLEQLNMSKAEFAQLIGVRPQDLYRWLVKKTGYQKGTVLRMEAILGINILNNEDDELT